MNNFKRLRKFLLFFSAYGISCASYQHRLIEDKFQVDMMDLTRCKSSFVFY